MKQNSWRLALVLAHAFLALGCGSDCESLCEDRKECPDASPDERARDCESSCDSQQEVADRFGCSVQTDDFLDCVASLEDLCDPPPDACAAEQAAVYQCRRTYCAQHPDDGACEE
jgi:hypothetical protein